MYACGRPQRLHRLYARALYFGFCWLLITNAFFATLVPLVLERKAKRLQKRIPFAIIACRGDDRDIHPLRRHHFVVRHLRERELLRQPKGVVPTTIERRCRETAKVADPGKDHVE